MKSVLLMLGLPLLSVHGLLCDNDNVPKEYSFLGNQTCTGQHIKDSLRAKAGCKPRLTVLRLPGPHGTELMQMTPTHVEVHRCGGGCQKSRLSCVPQFSQVKVVPIIVGKCNSNSNICDKECLSVEVEEHVECGCSCNLTSKDCSARHQFHAELCTCECLDKVEMRNCRDMGRFWSHETCSCQCPISGVQVCGDGMVFDNITCACIPSLHRGSQVGQLGKPIVDTKNNDTKFCTYKGRVVQLGETLPLPDMCAVMTCSLELINNSVLVPSIDLDRSLQGHGCCTGEDGSIYVEGSNRTRPFGQVETCHQGTWISLYDRQFCTYKGRMVQLGETLPLPDMCAVMTCSLELINDSVWVPSIDLDRSLPGHGCCTEEDGSIYVEGSNRTRPFGQEETCHQGTWISLHGRCTGEDGSLYVEGSNRTQPSREEEICDQGTWTSLHGHCTGEDGSIYVEGRNRTSPLGQEEICHQGTWQSLHGSCMGEDKSIHVEGSNRTRPSGEEETCRQGTWESLHAGLNLAVRPQSQDEWNDSSLIMFNKDQKKDKYGIHGWNMWQNRTKTFLEEHQKPLKKYLYCQDINYADGCIMAFKREDLQECGQGRFGYHAGTPCVILNLNRIFGLEYDYYQAETKADAYPEEFPQELAHHIYTQVNKKQVWVDCQGVNGTNQEMMGPLTYFPESRGFPASYFPYMDQAGYQSPLLAIKFERPTIGVLLNIECRAWAKNIEHGKVHFQLTVYSNEVNPKCRNEGYC